MTDGADDRIEISYRAGDPESGEVRVGPGTELVVTLYGSPGYGWTPITGADGPLAMVTQSEREGSVEAVLRAQVDGEVELRSSSSFAGDRFGPRTRLWRLRVSIHT